MSSAKFYGLNDLDAKVAKFVPLPKDRGRAAKPKPRISSAERFICPTRKYSLVEKLSHHDYLFRNKG
jgi:hypothetical protein